jgi:hypothetical protein
MTFLESFLCLPCSPSANVFCSTSALVNNAMAPFKCITNKVGVTCWCRVVSLHFTLAWHHDFMCITSCTVHSAVLAALFLLREFCITSCTCFLMWLVLVPVHAGLLPRAGNSAWACLLVISIQVTCCSATMHVPIIRRICAGLYPIFSGVVTHCSWSRDPICWTWCRSYIAGHESGNRWTFPLEFVARHECCLFHN